MVNNRMNSKIESFNFPDKFQGASSLLRRAKQNLNEVLTSIEDVIQNTKIDLIELQEQQKSLEKQKFFLQKRAQEQEREITGLTQEQHELLEEYTNVKMELEKLTRLASGDENVSIEDMRATLAIYSTLFQEVYSSEAHFKVLFLLHGDAEELSIEQLKGATGIGGAMILRACHELNKVHLVEFDMENKMVKLVKRLFPKKKKR